MARSIPLRQGRLLAAAAALAVLTVAAAHAGPAPYRDPYLGGRVAFSVADQRSGCVARMLDRPGITCDSTVAKGSIASPMQRPGVPPMPEGCTMGWGVRFSLPPRGAPTPECASTWIGSGHRVLRAPRRVRMGQGIVCQARRHGLRCVNRTGNGFVLTTRRVRLF